MLKEYKYRKGTKSKITYRTKIIPFEILLGSGRVGEEGERETRSHFILARDKPDGEIFFQTFKLKPVLFEVLKNAC
jgi:hypothetical protein